MPGRHVAPRHRASRSHSLGRLASDAISAFPTPGVAGTVAVVGATGVALGIGVLSTGEETAAESASAQSDASSSAPSAESGGDSGSDVKLDGEKVSELLAERREDDRAQVSRSVARPAAALSVQRKTKVGHLPVNKQEMRGQVTRTVEPTTPQDIAITLMADYGWGSDQFSCLDSLYVSESDWNHTATNPYSGAYGIPQALPAEKMASAGSDWRTNPATQIEWGLDYILSSYGTPCSAWSFKQANNWY